MTATLTFPAVGVATKLTVPEVCVAGPRTLAVIVRDDAPIRRKYIDTTAQAEAVDGVWRNKTYPVDGTTQPAWVMGIGKDGLRFSDSHPTVYVSRAAGKVAANWSLPGTKITVTRVGLISEPWDTGFYVSDGNGSNGSSHPSAFQHTFYLNLSRLLVSGTTYRVRFPDAWDFADYTFTFDDKVTRSPSIHVPFSGFRKGDPLKLAQLMFWMPNNGNKGAVNLKTEQGVSQWDVIDQTGATVYGPFDIPAGVSPTTPEALAVFPSTGPYTTTRKFVSTDSEHIMQVASFVSGASSTVTMGSGQVAAAGLVNGDYVSHGRLSQTFNVNLTTQKSGVDYWGPIQVKNISGDTFEMWDEAGTTRLTWAGGTTGAYAKATYADAGTAHRFIKMHTANSNLTWVHELDLSGFTTATDGMYAVRVIGCGRSHYFPIKERAWDDAARFIMRGDIHQRHGYEQDGRFGWTRGVALRHGYDGRVVYKSNFCMPWSSQGGDLRYVAVDWWTRCANWVTTTQIDAGGGTYDAGDWDTFGHKHSNCWVPALMAVSLVGTSAAATNGYNCPKASEAHVRLSPGTYGVPNVTLDWSEMDNVPAPLQQMAYNVGWQFRCQEADGSVPAGHQGTQESRAYITGIGQLMENSSNCVMQQYTYAPDIGNNYGYAQRAALLGRLLTAHGAPVLGAAWISSAVAAYDWAETALRKIWRSTASTSHTIGTGEKAFNAQFGTPWDVTDTVKIYSAANPANWMQGAVTQAIKEVGVSTEFKVNVTSTGGSGTFTDWVIVATDHDRYHYYDSLMAMRRKIVVTGTITTGSNVITGIVTTGIQVGDHVTGAGIPDDSIVESIGGSGGAGTVTYRYVGTFYNAAGVLMGDYMPNNATAAGSTTLTFRRYGMGLSDAEYETDIATVMQNAQGQRTGACGTLARATGTAIYRTRFESSYKASNFLGDDMYGFIEYLGADGNGISGAVTAVRDFCQYVVFQTGDAWISAISLANNPWRYARGGLFGMSEPFGNHGGTHAAIMFTAMFSPDSTKRTNSRKLLVSVVTRLLGGNTQNKAFVTGYGYDSFKQALHEDGMHTQGVSPDGIVLYGPLFNPAFANVVANTIFSGDQFSQINDFYYLSNAGNTHVVGHMIEPPSWGCYPGHHHFDVKHIIYESEFGMTGTMFAYATCYFLSRWDGNVVAS